MYCSTVVLSAFFQTLTSYHIKHKNIVSIIEIYIASLYHDIIRPSGCETVNEHILKIAV